VLLQALERVFARLFFWRKRSRLYPPPDPTRPIGSESLPEVRHIVVLMMENHSYDNYFGTLSGRGEGFPPGPLPSTPRADGTPVAAHHFASTVQAEHVPIQTWTASHVQWDGGRNDGFARSIDECSPGHDPSVAMGYWTEEDLPFYAGLARTFPLADRFFASCLGPTFPNRRFLIAGTANGLADDDPLEMVDYPQNGTIFDVLARYGITWANYRSGPGPGAVLKRLLGAPGLRLGRDLLRGLRGLWRALSGAIPALRSNLQFTADLYPVGFVRFCGHIKPIDRFFRDARDGTLPAFCIVDPEFSTNSEENPQDVRVGEAFAADVIQAVMHGKGWAGTLLVWLYDEGGGYYDHVPPPPAIEPDDVRAALVLDRGPDTYDRLGFRVPAVVVSPYSRPGYVSHAVHDHTSILKLVETKWNLPSLTGRDLAADDLLDSLDFSRPPAFLDPPSLPEPALRTAVYA
jgi:phospholipase C